MPNLISHFAIGMGGFLVILIIFGYETYRYAFPLAAGSGFWACIPDVHNISPYHNDILRLFHDTLIADVFWFHRIADQVFPNAHHVDLIWVIFLVTTIISFSKIRELRLDKERITFKQKVINEVFETVNTSTDTDTQNDDYHQDTLEQ